MVRLLFAALLSLALDLAAGNAALAQGCNPAVDGTYCASAGIRATPGATSPFNTRPAYSLGELAGPGYADSPATLGAITFGSDGSRCIGLIRRSNCRS